MPPAARRCWRPPRPRRRPTTKVVAVTVLTSLDRDDLARDRHRRFAERAGQAPGRTGARRRHRRHRLLGRRSRGGARGLAGRLLRRSRRSARGRRRRRPEARRHAREALDDGASVLVIGRPITGAADPAQAIRDIAASLEAREVIAMSWLSRVRSGIPFLPKRQTAENLWHKCKQVRDDGFRQGVGRKLQRLPALRLPRPDRPGQALRAIVRRRPV